MPGKKKKGKLIPLFSGLRRAKKPEAQLQQSGTQLFRQVVSYVRDRAKERHIGWSLIPALITLRIVSAENLKAIRSAFEHGPSDEKPVHPDLLADFLEMRRYFTAAIIYKAAENWKNDARNRKTSARIDELLDELQDLSDNQSWDWVSFHETEFEFFLQIANTSRFTTARFVLNRIKRDYLDSVLAFNKNFWNMQSAIAVYRSLIQLIRERKAPEAEGEILQFFTQNDLAILQYYASQVLAQGFEYTPQSPRDGLRPVYASNVAVLSDFEIGTAVRYALAEDKASADITTQAIFTDTNKAEGRIFVKSDCVLCGVRLAEQTFRYFEPGFTIKLEAADGDALRSGATVMRFKGDIRTILRGERVALNFIAFMSSIATRTRKIADLVRPYGVRVLDTRKTVPMLRAISKYAVVKGGGLNHRHDLSEMGLIKDNHIAQAGSVAAAILAFRRHAPFVPLEIEVDTLEQLDEALPLKPDMVLLDNMDAPTMAEAMRRIKAANKSFGTKITAEASGGFTATTLDRLKDTGVDFVSLGSITNTIEPPDFSLEII
ncbi:MAG: carboxylating nicotinate-nucleotide diphosphorylase [Turneriella sp.]|nr:carboxylating nicotinate-nucleotide diphosphorylase [Turneriella sp.]